MSDSKLTSEEAEREIERLKTELEGLESSGMQTDRQQEIRNEIDWLNWRMPTRE